MGGNLLRRKILNKYSKNLSQKDLTQRRKGAKSAAEILNFASSVSLRLCEKKIGIKVLFLIAVFGCFIPGRALVADEPPLFSRPLRGQQGIALVKPADFAGPQTVQSLSGLPSPYQSTSLLLTPEAMEKPLTQRYIRQYSSPGGIAWLSAVMKRADPYLAFIRKEIAGRNLPEELIYLPVIESGYLATALSKSGATGLWQFMKNSTGPFDMKVNDWVDERRDFWKSTQGALRKLEENYKYLGNWPLALAAYNAGLGAVNRAIQQSGIRDYWILSQENLLKTETIHYVPKLLAAAYILSNLRQFGMEARWPEDPQWKRVEVQRPADLRILAEEAGADSGELLSANRELLYNVTPPGQGYFLKVAQKDAEKVAGVLARTDIPLVHYYIHSVRSGDTLLALALHYGITVDQILESNPGVQARYLKLGSRLLIPAFKEAGPYVRPAPAPENLVFDGTHLVKQGETLWSIALAYEVDPEIFAQANGMELTDILREGRVLKTPIK